MIVVMWFVFQWRPMRPDKLPTTPQGPGGHGDCCAQQCAEWVGYICHLIQHTHSDPFSDFLCSP